MFLVPYGRHPLFVNEGIRIVRNLSHSVNVIKDVSHPFAMRVKTATGILQIEYEGLWKKEKKM